LPRRGRNMTAPANGRGIEPQPIISPERAKQSLSRPFRPEVIGLCHPGRWPGLSCCGPFGAKTLRGDGNSATSTSVSEGQLYPSLTLVAGKILCPSRRRPEGFISSPRVTTIPAGIVEISRWLSEATPPECHTKQDRPRQGSQRRRLRPLTGSGCCYVSQRVMSLRSTTG